VQNTVFQENENITLKEAVAANKFSKNIVWDIEPLDKTGTYLVSFEYDVDPISGILSTDFYNKSTVEYVLTGDSYNRTDKDIRDYRMYNEGDILSPIGFANIFTRFIQGEGLTPHTPGIEEEMKELLNAYTEYRKEYAEYSLFIPLDQMPDYLPEPFFVPTAAKFKGECFIELSNPEQAEFVRFSLLFDFRTPYLDNKEYKGVGITIHDGVPFYSSYEKIETVMGLAFVYNSYPMAFFHIWANKPLTRVSY
jgi:hypothetical protein